MREAGGRYSDAEMRSRARGVERVMGIEPTFSAWEADVLPLNYTRMREPEFYCIGTVSQWRSQGWAGRLALPWALGHRGWAA